MKNLRVKVLTALFVSALAISNVVGAASFDFSLLRGGTAHSARAYRDASKSYYTVNSTGGNQVQGKETVYFRARDNNHEYASNYITTTRYGSYSANYWNANSGYYYLYASLDAQNYWAKCNVRGTWTP